MSREAELKRGGVIKGGRHCLPPLITPHGFLVFYLRGGNLKYDGRPKRRPASALPLGPLRASGTLSSGRPNRQVRRWHDAVVTERAPFKGGSQRGRRESPPLELDYIKPSPSRTIRAWIIALVPLREGAGGGLPITSPPGRGEGAGGAGAGGAQRRPSPEGRRRRAQPGDGSRPRGGA